jgi:hypothetical protein
VKSNGEAKRGFGECAACGARCKLGDAVEAVVLSMPGVQRVCQECFRGALVVVAPKLASALRPYSAHLRKLAKAYELNADERWVGLAQAADILDAGKVPAFEAIPILETRVSTFEADFSAVGLSKKPMSSLLEPPRQPPVAPPARPPPKESKAALRPLGALERAVLQVLVGREPRRTSRKALALMAGYSHTSGSYASGLANLRARGLIDGGGAMGFRATSAGLGSLDKSRPERLPEGTSGLIAYWCERLEPCAAAILQVATTVYPDSLTRAALAERTGYSASSGSFAGALAKLRTLGLLEGNRASSELMGATDRLIANLGAAP